MTTGKPKSQNKWKPIWQDDIALKENKTRHKAWKRYLNRIEGQDYQAYIDARKEARRAVRRAVIDYEKYLASKCKKSSRHFWTFNSRSKPKGKIPALHYHGNTYITDRGKAEAISNSFASTFTHVNTTNLDALKQELEFLMDNIRITSDMVRKT
jgi:hypothetical protein